MRQNLNMLKLNQKKQYSPKESLSFFSADEEKIFSAQYKNIAPPSFQLPALSQVRPQPQMDGTGHKYRLRTFVPVYFLSERDYAVTDTACEPLICASIHLNLLFLVANTGLQHNTRFC